jgi:hypothetical protein
VMKCDANEVETEAYLGLLCTCAPAHYPYILSRAYFPEKLHSSPYLAPISSKYFRFFVKNMFPARAVGAGRSVTARPCDGRSAFLWIAESRLGRMMIG